MLNMFQISHDYIYKCSFAGYEMIVFLFLLVFSPFWAVRAVPGPSAVPSGPLATTPPCTPSTLLLLPPLSLTWSATPHHPHLPPTTWVEPTTPGTWGGLPHSIAGTQSPGPTALTTMASEAEQPH